MDSLGICFGAFDLILDPNGDFIFLEVNEAGQFLWIEEICPDFLVLAAFSAFLSGTSFNDWRPNLENRLQAVKSSKEYVFLADQQKQIAAAVRDKAPFDAPV